MHALAAPMKAALRTLLALTAIVLLSGAVSANEPDSYKAGDEISYVSTNAHPLVVSQRLWGSQSSVEMLVQPGTLGAESRPAKADEASPLKSSPLILDKTYSLPVYEQKWNEMRSAGSPDRGAGYFDVPWIGGINRSGHPYIFAGPENNFRLMLDGSAHNAFDPTKIFRSYAASMFVMPHTPSESMVVVLATDLVASKGHEPVFYRFLFPNDLGEAPPIRKEISGVRPTETPGTDWALVDAHARDEDGTTIVAALFNHVDNEKFKVVWYQILPLASGWIKLDEHQVNKGSASTEFPAKIESLVGRITSPAINSFVVQVQSIDGTQNFVLEQRNGKVNLAEGTAACPPVRKGAPLTLTPVAFTVPSWVQSEAPAEGRNQVTGQAVCFAHRAPDGKDEIYAVERHPHENDDKKWASKVIPVGAANGVPSHIQAASTSWKRGGFAASGLQTTIYESTAVGTIYAGTSQIFHRTAVGEVRFDIAADQPNGYRFTTEPAPSTWKVAEKDSGGWHINVFMTDPIYLRLEGTLTSDPSYDGGEPHPLVYFMPPPSVANAGQEFDPPYFVATESSGVHEGTNFEIRAGAIMGFEADFGAGPLTSGVDYEFQIQGQWGNEKTTERTFSDAIVALGASEEASVLTMRVPTWALEMDVSSSSIGITGDYVHLEPAGPIGYSVVTESLLSDRYGLTVAVPEGLRIQAGDPRTYPKISETASAESLGCETPPAWAKDKHHVGIGDGRTGSELSIETVQTETHYRQLDLEGHAVGKAKGIKVGLSGGLTWGESWGFTETSGITLGAEMGQLPDAFNDQGYTWQMFMCEGAITATTSAGAEVSYQPWVLGYATEKQDVAPPKGLSEPTPTAPMEYSATSLLPRLAAKIDVDKYQTVSWELEGVGIHDRRTAAATFPTGAYEASWKIKDPLTAGHTYRWRVWIEQPALGSTDKTVWNYFVPMGTPPTPTLSTPVLVDDEATFTWDAPQPRYWTTTATLSRHTPTGYAHVASADVEGAIWHPAQTLSPGEYRLHVLRETDLGGMSASTLDFAHDPAAPLHLLASASTAHLGDPVIFTVLRDDDISDPIWSTTAGALDGDRRTIAFDAPGPHTVSVTAQHHGSEVEATSTVIVTNPAPVVDFQWMPEQPTAGGTLSFAWEALDPDGGPVTIEWSTGGKPPQSFATPGIHRICLSASDNDGTAETEPITASATTTVCRDVTVLNRAPNATFVMEAPDGSQLGAPLGVGQHTVLRSASTDPDGQELTLEWEIGTVAQEGGTAHLTPQRPGPILACLTATDADGARDRYCATLDVPDAPPKARIAVHPAGAAPEVLFALEGVPVRLVDRSTDDGGLRSRWTEPFYTEAATFEHAFSGTGPTRVCLQVEDTAGQTDEACQRISVINPRPTPEFHWFSSPQYAGSIIQFRDASTDPNSKIAGWYWTFDDGDVATIRHPVKVFEMPGDFNVCLTVRDEHGALNAWGAQACQIVNVTNPPPVAAFDVVGNDALVGSEVSFEDLSTDINSDITQWRWDLGDGSHASIQHPFHRFSWPGSYDVCLQVQDEHGAWSTADPPVCLPVNVTNIAPEANFQWADGIFARGDPLPFTDLSTDANDEVRRWQWDFGDGATSDLKHPVHTFAADGKYLVCLTAYDLYDEPSVKRCHDVTIYNPPPTAAFDGGGAAVYTYTDIAFEDASTDANGDVLAWSWDFGDGATSTDSDPIHAYADDGTYRVCLIVWDRHGDASEPACRDVEILNRPPQPDFRYAQGASRLFGMQFLDESADMDGTVERWEWSFPGSNGPLLRGDGGSSSNADPRHTFDRCGVKQVTLTVWDDDGASSSVRLPVDVFETLVDTPVVPVHGIHAATPLIGIESETPQRTAPTTSTGTCLFMDPMVQVHSPAHPSARAWKIIMGGVDGAL